MFWGLFVKITYNLIEKYIYIMIDKIVGLEETLMRKGGLDYKKDLKLMFFGVMMR